MRYLPLTDDDRRAMLAAVGVPSVDSLYSDVPQKVRLTKPVDLPPFKSELEVERHMTALAAKNLGASSARTFFLVTLPLIRPGVVAGAVFAFIISFDELVVSLFLAGPGMQTLPIRIFTSLEYSSRPSV